MHNYGFEDNTTSTAVFNSDRGITIYCSKKMTDDELRENIMCMNQAIVKPSDEHKEEATLKDQSFMFMMAKDKSKIDLIQLRKEIKAMSCRSELYILLRDELIKLGHWKQRPRGKPGFKSNNKEF